MIEHHIQKKILHILVKNDSVRFRDLRPKNLDSNLVTYHLKQLIKQGYVKKSDGPYSLTPRGKVVGATITLSKEESLFEAHSVLLIALTNSAGQWLLRKRRVQPMFGWSGFVHGEPVAGRPINESAREILFEKTGLKASKFRPRASGYVTFMEGDVHQSFIHFTLLYTENFSGELIEDAGNGENYWYLGDFQDEMMLPSMKPLVDAIESEVSHSFFELTY